jgi:iron complex outermembrane receptor protein
MFIHTKNKTKRLKHAFIAQSIALALACSTSVLAAQSIDIKEQSLADALKILGQQTGLQIIYNADLITGKHSPAVQGSYETTEVLQQLLNGSHVTFNLSENTVTLISINDISSKNMGTLALTKIGDISSKDGSAEAGYRVENISGIGIYKERSLQETPYAITVLSDSLIENVIAGDTDQLFKMTPTVQAAGLKSNYGSQPIVIRGSYSSSPAIDGMSVVGRYGSSTEDVERVEVLTGLSGFLYGASAIDSVGGKINYVYKRPTKERLTKLTLGNYGGEQYFIHADLGGPIGDDGQLGYRLNLVKQDGDTMVDDQHINKLLISGAFDWHITDDLLMQLHLSHRDYKLDGRSSFISPDLDNMDNILDTSSPIIETSTALTPSWASFENKTNQAKFDITWDISDVVTLRSSYYTKKNRNPLQYLVNNVDTASWYHTTFPSVYYTST